MIVHFGVLEKFVRLNPAAKFFFANEAIIFALDFTRARLARCAGNGVNEIRRLPERFAQSGFTRARGSGNDKQNSAAREMITQGSGFVREFFPAPPCSRRRAAKS